MREGEGLRATGKEFTAKSTPSMVGFIDYTFIWIRVIRLFSTGRLGPSFELGY